MLEERLRKWIDAYDQNGYLNGTLLIACNGNIVVNEGFGMANWEHQVPNTASTKFRIGSITKAFTAMSLFQLQEMGKLDIHDAVDKYIPGYPNGDRISLYHCLTNTSGIPNYTSFPDFWSHRMRLPATLDHLIDSFKTREPDFEPGSRFGYSNSGYALLTAIIEAVSGMSYSAYIREHICLPLGMHDTGCDDGRRIIPRLASGYTFYEEPIHTAFADMSFPLGAYGGYSTTEDLYKWDLALKNDRLLSTESMKKMFTVHLGSYACGWMVSDILGRTCIHHFGDVSGYFCDFLRFVDDGVTIIFLSNMSIVPVTHLTREVAKVIFEGNASIPKALEPIRLQKNECYAGRYYAEHESNHVFDIMFQNNELYLTVPKMYGVIYKFKLVPVYQDSNTTTFLTEMIHEQLVFHQSETGDIEFVEYTDYVNKHRRLSPPDIH